MKNIWNIIKKNHGLVVCGGIYLGLIITPWLTRENIDDFLLIPAMVWAAHYSKAVKVWEKSLPENINELQVQYISPNGTKVIAHNKTLIRELKFDKNKIIEDLKVDDILVLHGLKVYVKGKEYDVEKADGTIGVPSATSKCNSK